MAWCPSYRQAVCAAFAKVACLVFNSFAFGGSIEPGNAGGFCGQNARPPKLSFLPTSRVQKAEQGGCSMFFTRPHTWHWAGRHWAGLCSPASPGPWLPCSPPMTLSLPKGISATASHRLQWEREKWHGMGMAGMAAQRDQQCHHLECLCTDLPGCPCTPVSLALLLHLSVCCTHQILCRHVTPGTAVLGSSQHLSGSWMQTECGHTPGVRESSRF